ncbi:FtsX-like permease family protein [Limihaloglobus sulfuriphilus]|uniref:FtsX-like permease family protein n=1 Tax=Limihaloglobus sulfuriphilus TaxID=1851148 RepID=A0A1Q2MAL2_9BACT|nr:ABC transporter permease [Limihaloglobus sulfuriphilus]AQQ69763.1 FtsX-like permease family protein [Limihaloglobus sulfuriphilus]
MTKKSLIFKSIAYYWKGSLGVVAASMVASAVIVGALAVGDSVRSSLRGMVDSRIGIADIAVVSQDNFFTGNLSGKMAKGLDADTAAIIQISGIASNDAAGRRANRINVYGVDQRFYNATGCVNPFRKSDENAVILNKSLAQKINASAGDEILLRFARPSAMSRDIALTPASDMTVGFRLRVARIADNNNCGDFSLKADHIPPLNAFVPLEWLGQSIETPGKANLMLISAGADSSIEQEKAENVLADSLTLADMGLEISEVNDGAFYELRSSSVFIRDDISAAALSVGSGAQGLLSYFVNSIRRGDKEVPYSFVAGCDSLMPDDAEMNDIVINRWLAEDISAEKGGEIEIDYYTLGRGRELVETTSAFNVADVIEIEGMAADRSLMPDFPGLADAENCREWEPGIDIDLERIRDKDERYWDEYKGTPKAFVSLRAAEVMWGNRYGNLTAVRWPAESNGLEDIAAALRGSIAGNSGIQTIAIRQMSLKAIEEGTDFGPLFIGFSMFIIASAIVMLALVFVLGVEKRISQSGLLSAIGFTRTEVKKVFLLETMILVAAGSLLGVGAGVIYTRIMLLGLRSLWSTAVSGADITFHVEPLSLVYGLLGGLLGCAAAVWLAFRKQMQIPISQMLYGSAEPIQQAALTDAEGCGIGLKGKKALLWQFLLLLPALGIVVYSSSAGAFFAAGGLLLASFILFVRSLIKSSLARGRISSNLVSLAWRNTARSPGRSISVVTMLACGVFIVISVGLNRKDPAADARTLSAGTGGFELICEPSVPLVHNLNTEDGRKETGLDNLAFEWNVLNMRVNQGDDASCFNLNRAQMPRLIAADVEKIQQYGFRFKKSAQNIKDGWQVLSSRAEENVIPAVGDEATVKWGLGLELGDEIDYIDGRGRPFKVRIAGVIENSIFQGSLIISRRNFEKRFEDLEGYAVVLADCPPQYTDQLSKALSGRLRDIGMEVTPSTERLRAFSEVENTYISIFQVLGSLGVVIGCLGLGVVVVRNVLDRSGELAMMRAVGFDRQTLQRIVFYEHIFLLLVGLAGGAVSAFIAVLPVILEPGGGRPVVSLVITLAVIMFNGFLWIWLGSSAALSGSIIESLRRE